MNVIYNFSDYISILSGVALNRQSCNKKKYKKYFQIRKKISRFLKLYRLGYDFSIILI